MPLSPEDQVRYDQIKAQNTRIAASIAAPSTLQMDMSDQARMDRLRQLNARVAANNPPTPPLDGPGAEPPAYGDAADRAAADQRGKGILAQLPTIDATTAARQTGGTLVDTLPTGADTGQRVVAQPSRLIGGRIQDGIPQPTFQSDYSVYGNAGRQGVMRITGPDRRAGGGTLSVLDQGNGGTVEGNVAAYNRQIEALQSLREARNPGITTGQAGRAFGGLVSFGTPGGGVGQEPLDANRSPALSDLFAGQPGGARSRRDLLSLMELQQRDQHFNAQQQQQAAQQAAQQQAGILRGAQEAQAAAANRQWEQAKWGQQYGLDQQRLALDQQSRQSGILKDLAGLNQERTKEALFGQYLGAKDEGQQRAALDALLAYQGKDPQQGGVLVFDAPTGAKDLMGNPLTAKTLYDTRRREVIQPGAGIAGDGRPQSPADLWESLVKSGMKPEEATAEVKRRQQRQQP